MFKCLSKALHIASVYETCYMNKLAFTFQSTASHGNDLLVYEYKAWTQFIFGV